jgi:hypothetical protein
MSRIRVANVCGGFLFGIGLLLGIHSISQIQTSLIQAIIITQSEKGGDAKAFIDLSARNLAVFNLFLFQTGIGAAFA